MIFLNKLKTYGSTGNMNMNITPIYSLGNSKINSGWMLGRAENADFIEYLISQNSEMGFKPLENEALNLLMKKNFNSGNDYISEPLYNDSSYTEFLLRVEKPQEKDHDLLLVVGYGVDNTLDILNGFNEFWDYFELYQGNLSRRDEYELDKFSMNVVTNQISDLMKHVNSTRPVKV